MLFKIWEKEMALIENFDSLPQELKEKFIHSLVNPPVIIDHFFPSLKINLNINKKGNIIMSCRTDNFRKRLKNANTVAQAQAVMKKYQKEKDAFDKRKEQLRKEAYDSEVAYSEHCSEDNFYMEDCESRFKEKVGNLTLEETKK